MNEGTEKDKQVKSTRDHEVQYKKATGMEARQGKYSAGCNFGERLPTLTIKTLDLRTTSKLPYCSTAAWEHIVSSCSSSHVVKIRKRQHFFLDVCLFGTSQHVVRYVQKDNGKVPLPQSSDLIHHVLCPAPLHPRDRIGHLQSQR